ncbi:transaldolase [Sulfidibacter corallicola]|uniref:Transaldolase n=1 Tax=Sulfidibacter corallicola TaxID=2818388 RepID=A0A8A4TVH1_SULCO|nr:transaldolase [Sulfidibacter corallicola]QTD53483.1 transaldolase [Sulfidibacter corallicola]
MTSTDLKIKVFADGADLDDIRALNGNPLIRGFTTNPTLMRAAGVTEYEAFARRVLEFITDKPISFEVFADELELMYRQAKVIASWGGNVNVKIPVTNTKGQFTGPILERLSREGVQVNVTAVFTHAQVRDVLAALCPDTHAIVSVFAGRIADTGLDPIPYMEEAAAMIAAFPHAELLWASPREVLNIYQADAAGCDIITVTPNLLKKLSLQGKNLDEFSLDTVKMFYKDATTAGYQINLD